MTLLLCYPLRGVIAFVSLLTLALSQILIGPLKLPSLLCYRSRMALLLPPFMYSRMGLSTRRKLTGTVEKVLPAAAGPLLSLLKALMVFLR